MTQFPTSPETESALSVLIKQYALDLRRNASGGDDYPYDFAKGVANYLGVLIKRAKGNCTCAQDGFPDSCDNCDAFGLAQTPDHTYRDTVRRIAAARERRMAEMREALERIRNFPHDKTACEQAMSQIAGEALSDTSTDRPYSGFEVRCPHCESWFEPEDFEEIKPEDASTVSDSSPDREAGK